MSTGLNITLFTTVAELENAKKGGSMVLAVKAKNSVFNVQVTAPLEAVEFPNETDVRINVESIKREREELMEAAGERMGAAMGAELEKAFKGLGA